METKAACGHVVTLPTEADRLPRDVPARAHSGDLWALGEHRLLCGDAYVPGALRRAVGTGEPRVLVFDPPFNVPMEQPNWSVEATFVFTDNDYLPATLATWGAARAVLVWDCVAADPRVSNRPLRQMKLCLYYGDWSRYDWRGDVWDRRVPRPQRRTTCQLGEVFRMPIAALARVGLPHQKPVDWLRRLVGCLTKGDMLDPCAGTGTSFIVAEQLGRRCFGVELDPARADVILARWEAWTGGQARRLEAGDG